MGSSLIAMLALSLCAPTLLRAQTETTGTRPSGPGTRTLGPLSVAGSWRVRFEGWDWFDSGAGENSYAFPHSLFRLTLGQSRDRFDWQVEGAQASILALPENSVAGAPQGQLGLGATYFAANGNRRNNAGIFLKQALVRWKRLGNGSLRVGRFEFADGMELAPKDAALATLARTRIAHRLVGDFGWAAVGRSLDGAQFRYDFNAANLTLVGGRATRGVFQTDGMGQLDADLFYGAATFPVQSNFGPGHLRAFGLGYFDHRQSVLKTDNRPVSVRLSDREPVRLATWGASYLHAVDTARSGRFNVVLWGAIQSGSWGQLAHRAGAFYGEFGWQPPVQAWSPWLSAGYSYGSGDGDSTDTRHGTFFQVLPTPRLYARFPFYNMQNNQDFLIALNLRPHDALAIRSELHALRLSSANDLWYQGGGVFQPRTFGYVGRPANGSQSLANVWDISADCRLRTDLTVSFYYARAWGKSVIANIYPRQRNGQLAYLETILRF